MISDGKIVMYMHAGSKNHGCEAIVNSICRMLKEPVLLISYRGEEDTRYTLDALCEIQSERSFSEHKFMHLLYYLYRKVTGDEESFLRFRYGDILLSGRKLEKNASGNLKSVPLAISIGGDNYCYENMLSDLRLSGNAFRRQGTETVLLGCSIEPELLEREDIVADLRRYHTIIARESITYEAIRGAFRKAAEVKKTEEDGAFMPQVLLLPDPAFTLPKKELPLPEGFKEDNTVGINVSPMILQNEGREGIAMANFMALIEDILDHTDMNIALIPHVVWENNDDRIPLHELYEIFEGEKFHGRIPDRFWKTGRIVEIPDGSCEELKGYISRCRFFIGARTHATIAAYSSCVPTLVVGYSVKARGIARDLFGTEETYVLPVQNLKEKEELADAFRLLRERETECRRHLETVMPGYRENALQTGEKLEELWKELKREITET